MFCSTRDCQTYTTIQSDNIKFPRRWMPARIRPVFEWIISNVHLIRINYDLPIINTIIFIRKYRINAYIVWGWNQNYTYVTRKSDVVPSRTCPLRVIKYSTPSHNNIIKLITRLINNRSNDRWAYRRCGIIVINTTCRIQQRSSV